MPKPACIMLCLTLLSPPLFSAQANATERSFEECQALAVSRGVLPKYTTKVSTRYLRYKAAGTAIEPKGIIARCMAGR